MEVMLLQWEVGASHGSVMFNYCQNLKHSQHFYSYDSIWSCSFRLDSTVLQNVFFFFFGGDCGKSNTYLQHGSGWSTCVPLLQVIVLFPLHCVAGSESVFFRFAARMVPLQRPKQPLGDNCIGFFADIFVSCRYV